VATSTDSGWAGLERSDGEECGAVKCLVLAASGVPNCGVVPRIGGEKRYGLEWTDGEKRYGLKRRRVLVCGGLEWIGGE
jgi:hypothetical protein